jgi:hypothetical protein
MSHSKPAPTNRGLTLEVRANFTSRPANLQAVMAYAFSQGGAVLGLQALDKEGRATLSLPVGQEPQAVRVVLGPELPKDLLDVGELLRRGGVDRHIAVRPNMERLTPLVVDIGPEISSRWIGRLCEVNGTLLKSVLSGGVTLRLPVCNAAVDIYEVDPWLLILPKLPELDIGRLRDIIEGPWPPIDLPIPPRPPEPFIGDLTFDPAGGRLARVGLNPQPLPPRESARMSRMAMNPGVLRGFNPQPDPPHEVRSLAWPAALQVAARASRPQFERAVGAHLDVLRPILCWLFPRWVNKTKLTTVMTDECGHFHALIWRSIFNFDQPDLYFTARQRVWPFFWVTIYEPTPVACHTWWDYVCGTEVTLVTTHPAAHACSPCPPIIAPNNWVLFMALGNTSVWRIHGANDSTRVGAPGHDPALHGLLDDAAPWGGSLRPRLEFDSSLRSDLGLRYYRVMCKRASEDETQWRPSTEAINRHYTHEVGADLILEQYALGPQTVGTQSHLCEIPPALPPLGQWSWPNVVFDTQSAVLPTATFAPGHGFDAAGAVLGVDEGGLWQIKVELFDGLGNLVDPEALGIQWRVPASNDLTGTIQTRDAATLGLVDAALNRMRLTVRLDNNPTYARIDAPAVGGATAADECGVMNYATRALAVDVPFLALQRNRFASYSFYVQRGAVSPAEYSVASTAAATMAGMAATIPPSPPGDPLPTVGSLLDACTLAGFTEQLYVAHSGTDGWSRLSGYDSSAARAFVLAPILS